MVSQPRIPFVHPVSHIPLVKEEGGFRCPETQEHFPVRDGVPVFLSSALQEKMGEERSGFVNSVKTFLRRFPRVYVFLIYIISPVCFVGMSPKKFLRRFDPDAVILNIGSGVHRLQQNIINVDIFPYRGVDIVADATNLPFDDSSVDGVLCEFLLEHVPHPRMIVEEIQRVLKSGGSAYVAVPFVYPFHASPNDFYRWSVPGLRELCRGGDIEVVAPRAGPVSALVAQLVTCLAIVLSFGLTPLYNLFSLLLLFVFFPLKFLDCLFGRFPTAIHGAADVYAVFRKR